MSPSRLLRLAVAALAAAWLVAPTEAQDAAPPASDPSLPAFLDRLEAAFQTRDVSGWLALREFETPDERQLEEETLRVWFATDEVVFTLLRRPTARPGDTRFVVEAQVFIATEPRAASSSGRCGSSGARRAGRWCRGRRSARWTASCTSRSGRRRSARAA